MGTSRWTALNEDALRRARERLAVAETVAGRWAARRQVEKLERLKRTADVIEVSSEVQS